MLSLLLTYLILLVVVYFGQRKLIYFPDRYQPETHRQLVAQAGLEYWPDAENYRALISRIPQPRYRGTIFIMHGNAGSAVTRIHYFQALEHLGYRVIVNEYPGYGARPGQATETAFVEDATETAKQILQQYGEPLLFIGESLGGGVSTGIIAQNSIANQGLILITPFDKLPNLAQTHFPWLPAKWLTRDQFDNIANLQHYTGPVAIALAERDKIIPNRHTLKLYEALATRKQLWQFKDSDHNDWPSTSDLKWWLEALAFIDRS